MNYRFLEAGQSIELTKEQSILIQFNHKNQTLYKALTNKRYSYRDAGKTKTIDLPIGTVLHIATIKSTRQTHSIIKFQVGSCANAKLRKQYIEVRFDQFHSFEFKLWKKPLGKITQQEISYTHD